jgi:hypothetical protein
LILQAFYLRGGEAAVGQLQDLSCITEEDRSFWPTIGSVLRIKPASGVVPFVVALCRRAKALRETALIGRSKEGTCYD